MENRKPKGIDGEQGPSCPNCGKLTSLTKRPEPDYNLRYLSYQRQVFTCPACGQQTERILNVDGHPGNRNA